MTQVRVFVNAVALDVNLGATALDCVQAWKADEAASVRQGARLITDSRGLPIPNDSPASAGSIYRTVSNRSSARDD